MSRATQKALPPRLFDPQSRCPSIEARAQRPPQHESGLQTDRGGWHGPVAALVRLSPLLQPPLQRRRESDEQKMMGGLGFDFGLARDQGLRSQHFQRCH